ncbi:TOP2B [Symbiodinium necroappetens]|uniref:DNA topoisomerase (ATP-hydrolyzing) n=1 Tax=Symbiodinium necroappetens TaxID=1628268 RepID=A0A812JUI4_9DINO|nr:TOP2B [Symbiodinium necroappetens]
MGALSPPSRALGQVVSNSSTGRAGPEQATLSGATLYSERARSVAAENSAAALPLCSALREILAFGGRLEVYISPLAKGRATPTKRSEEAEEEEGSEEEEDQDTSADVTKKAVRDFEYLVGMPISTLTAEKVAKLMQEHEVKARELKELQKKKPSDLWLEDLQALEVALDERDAAACDAEEKEKAKIQKAKAKNAKVSKGAGLCTCR